MKTANLNNVALLNVMELSNAERLQFEGGSWIGNIGEAVGGALGFATGLVVRTASEAAKALSGPLISRNMR